MHLPGRLSVSTLGDLLGMLHRQSISGTIELSEIAGPRAFAGRAHRVHLRAGLVVAIETDLWPGGRLQDRLDALFALEDARIAFRTPRPLPSGTALGPLAPAEFLHGRPRARDVRAGRRPPVRPPTSSASPPASPRGESAGDASEQARRLLGLPPEAEIGDVRRAFRRLASALHPDRAPLAAAEERARQAARFAELSAAYHLLVA